MAHVDVVNKVTAVVLCIAAVLWARNALDERTRKAAILAVAWAAAAALQCAAAFWGAPTGKAAIVMIMVASLLLWTRF